MNTLVTSDLHFRHANIIKYCNRPFSSVEDMDRQLINNWNSVVGQNDTIYMLGDFIFGSENDALKYFKRLNGKIYVIWGNHDKAIKNLEKSEIYKQISDRVKFLGDYAKININGQSVILTHYAMKVWDGSHRGSWNLYGHSHGTLPDDPNSLSFDCGVDCHNYYQISFDKVKQIMSKKTWVPIDHHGADKLPDGGNGHSPEEYAKLERKALYESLKKEFGND